MKKAEIFKYLLENNAKYIRFVTHYAGDLGSPQILSDEQEPVQLPKGENANNWMHLIKAHCECFENPDTSLVDQGQRFEKVNANDLNRGGGIDFKIAERELMEMEDHIDLHPMIVFTLPTLS